MTAGGHRRPLAMTGSASRRSGPALAALALLAALAAGGCSDGAGTGPVPGLPPTVLDVSPDVLRRGDTAVLHGLNFAPAAGENRVDVAGSPAQVLPPAEPTRLRIRLAGSGEMTCEPTRPVEIEVTVRGQRSVASHPLAAVAPLELAGGESFRASSADSVRCTNLPSGEKTFLLSFFNASTAPGNGLDFRIRGRPGELTPAGGSEPGTPGAGSRAGAPEPTVASMAGSAGVSPDASSLLEAVLRGRRAEAGIVGRGRELLRRSRIPTARSTEDRGPSDGGPPSVGELVEFRVPSVTRADACANYETITARVVHVSETAVVVEDTAAPLAGQMDQTYAALAAEYESVMDPIIQEYFGDPLVYDHRLDDDGHFYMLFTPVVNRLSNVLAFVWGGDYVDRTTCASSDRAEVFYGLVPTRRGGGPFDLASVEGWERVMRSTTIHEVKHIAAFAAHEAGGSARQEDSWLEEATAMVAEELYAREIFGYGPGENVGYEVGLRCEMNPDDAGCDDPPLAVAAHFSFLREYLTDLEDRSPLGGGVAYLGGAWWLLRWALDHAEVSEQEFLRALTPETSLFGVENLEARAGRPFPEMLADWTLALAADDRPGAAEPIRSELTVPSWDVRSVFEGLHRDRPESFPTPFPLEPRVWEYGDYLLSVSDVPGGTAVLVELEASSDVQQLLELLGGDGGTPPPELGLSILRVR